MSSAPPGRSAASRCPGQLGDRAYLNTDASQQLLTGPQAQAYADHFIATHVAEAAGGQTYAQVSAKAQADPTNATLTKQAQTLFQGETLRGPAARGLRVFEGRARSHGSPLSLPSPWPR